MARGADGTADFGELPSGLSLRVEDSRVERACDVAPRGIALNPPRLLRSQTGGRPERKGNHDFLYTTLYIIAFRCQARILTTGASCERPRTSGNA